MSQEPHNTQNLHVKCRSNLSLVSVQAIPLTRLMIKRRERVKTFLGVVWIESRLRLLPLFTLGFCLMRGSWEFFSFLLGFYGA